MEIISRPSPNFNARPQGQVPNMVVIHYTEMPSAEAAIARLCDPQAQVSAHYVVARDGAIYRLVDEDKRAWHAGVSYWQGAENVNDCSIGIELDNAGWDSDAGKMTPYPAVQMTALEALLEDIVSRHSIAPSRFVGHSDIAPTRKQDPGVAFEWARLAQNGFGLWADAAQTSDITEEAFIADLVRIGYRLPDNADLLRATVVAFQRHFLPHNVSGDGDVRTYNMARAIASLV